MDDKATIGLMIQRVTNLGTEHVRCTVMQRKPGEDYPAGVGSWWAHEGKPFYDGLRMGGHVDDHGDLGFVSHGFGYYEVFAVELHHAKAMVAMLTKIHKQCEKERAHEQGDIFLAFAKAVGAQWVVRPTGGRVKPGSWSNTTWYFTDELPDGRNMWRDLIRDAVRESNERRGVKEAA